MGTWGTGIFSDDIAADVRDEYRNCLEDGMSGASATDKVLAIFKDSRDDHDEGPPFWLSLAATQFRYGRLEDRVREKAIATIDDGSDLARFKRNPKQVRARQQVLEKLRKQLLGPQREPTKVGSNVPCECDWDAGEVIAYQRSSGDKILLHVQGIGQDGRSRYPTLCVLDLPFEQIDFADEHTPIRRLSVVARIFQLDDAEKRLRRFGPCPDCFTLFLTARDLKSPRLRRTGKIIKPRVAIENRGVLGGAACLSWKLLDAFLDGHLVPS